MDTTLTDRRHSERGAARARWLLTQAGILLVGGVTVLEVWANPPGWLSPAHGQTVRLLHWADVHWLNALAVTALATVAIALETPWLDRRRAASAAGQAAPRDQQRTMMLRRVRYKWITGVLEPSLANAARLALGLQPRPDALGLGSRVRRQAGHPAQPLPADMPISEVFDKVGGGLLILGAPGAGKTTVLLQLADELLARAHHDPGQSIPVVANLASWARDRKPFEDWLAHELAASYTVPERLAQGWVDHDALIVLLDGLDEIAATHRAACAEAINTWRRGHGLVPLVVCSRTAEFEALAATLHLEEAVELRPPSDAQIETYLGYLEQAGTPLAEVRAAMESDQELHELLRSPLMLHVVALAYHGRSALALQQAGLTVQRQAWLWDAYIERMFEQRPLPRDCGYTPQQARHWLAKLARALAVRDQTEFRLDRLTPSWLPTLAQQRHARQLMSLSG